MATKPDFSAFSSILNAIPPLGPGPRSHLLKAIRAVKGELRKSLRRLEKIERRLRAAR